MTLASSLFKITSEEKHDAASVLPVSPVAFHSAWFTQPGVVESLCMLEVVSSIPNTLAFPLLPPETPLIQQPFQCGLAMKDTEMHR